ncbi:hypothetical protein ACHWQZ_G011410 [Mnemiopsis leidyi]
MQRLKLTLAILKPDVYAQPIHHKRILKLIQKEGFIVANETVASWNQQQAKAFYKEHDGKFFQQRLVEFMSSGEFHAMVLAHKTEDAITKWRGLLGFTKCYKARHQNPTSIRAMYGLSDTRNAGHGSDSLESFVKEYEIIFPGWDPQQWATEFQETSG